MESVAVTASRYAQSILTEPSSLSVISEDELRLIRHTHITETLNRVPGVLVSRGNGQEHLTAIRSAVLTGAGSCGAFTVAEDGVPVRATGFCNVNQLFDLNTEQAQRIEVLRGPGTVMHNSDALHGVINVITQPAPQSRETHIGFEAGANDYYRLAISQGDSDGPHGYRLNFNGASDGGYKDDSGFDQQKLTARHDYTQDTVSVNTLLSLSNINQETAGYVSGTDAYKDDSRKRENGDPAAFRDSQTVRLQSHLTMQLAKDSVFIATPYARYTDMRFLMHFLPGTPLEENGQKSVGIQTLYQRPMTKKLQLSQGFDAEYTDAFLKQTQDGGFGVFPAGKQYDYEVKAKVLAAFLNADYQLTPATTFAAGGRYEYLEYNYDNQMLDGSTDENGVPCSGPCRYSRPADSEDDFDNWSFNTSLTHLISDENVATLRLAHGFRAPQATEMYRLQNGQLKANLDSEEINSVETSFRHQGSTLDYQLTAYFMKKNNEIFQSSDRINLADGKSESYGLEYHVGWSISDAWDINLAGSFARHQYTENVAIFGAVDDLDIDGNDIDTAPRRFHSLQLGWNPADTTRVELEWLSMGKYYTDINNLHSYEGHDLYNLRLRHQLTKHISIGLRVNNLTDIDYAERADFSGFGGDRYFIGEPRSYYGDISFSF